MEICLGWCGNLVGLEICWVEDIAGLVIGVSFTFGWARDLIGMDIGLVGVGREMLLSLVRLGW